MRTSTFLAAGAVVVPAALAGRSPVPASYGFNQAIMFTVNQQQNNITTGLSTSMTPSAAQSANIIALGGIDLLTPPPVFNHQGNCCRPTPQCHAYFKWIIDTLNSPEQFDTAAQKAEAMSHMDCCLKQFRASCSDPPKGLSIIWKDPAKGCSNDPDETFQLPGDVGAGAAGGADGVNGGGVGPVIPEPEENVLPGLEVDDVKLEH